jgi:hypothetical protein
MTPRAFTTAVPVSVTPVAGASTLTILVFTLTSPCGGSASALFDLAVNLRAD